MRLTNASAFLIEAYTLETLRLRTNDYESVLLELLHWSVLVPADVPPILPHSYTRYKTWSEA